MPTRLYIPAYALWPHPGVPTPSASWGDTSVSTGQGYPACLVVGVTATPSNYMPVSLNWHDNVAVVLAGPINALTRSYITPPLAGDQTITGNVKGQARTGESHSSANAMSQLTIRVIQSDLSTIRGTLLATHTNALSSEWTVTGTAYTNRKIPLSALSPATLTSVSALTGDRILVEIGARKTEAGTTSRNYSLRINSGGATDLAEDETSTADNNPWVEFSQALTFESDGPRIGSVLLLGMGA